MKKRIKAQLFVMGLIESMDVSDEACLPIIRAWFHARGQSIPGSDKQILASLQAANANGDDDADDADDEDDDEEMENRTTRRTSDGRTVVDEQAESRLADLRAAAQVINSTVGREAVTDRMVLDAFDAGDTYRTAMEKWSKQLAEQESSIPSNRVNVTGEGADRYAQDIVDALVYRASDNQDMELSDDAAALTTRPLWAVAGECLQMVGQQVDMYGSREDIAERAMQMGNDAYRRHSFYSANEDRRYIQAAGGTPFSRPGDFPNILSNLMNRFLDVIELDEDYSFEQVSALLPSGLNDFKPATMVNRGVFEELDELQDAEDFKQLGFEEEVLSYLFLRRFGNCWGWTPVMIANDDLNAFAEGMLGLETAWQTTQNRLVVDRFTSNENLLDGNALFANRADTGVGANPATNNNDRTSGGAPSDSEWEAMELLYADIGGVATGRRVRGVLNTLFVPTGTVFHEAERYFGPLNLLGMGEQLARNTTGNISRIRGRLRLISESELRVNSAVQYYGLRNPTRLNTATVVRAYFNGFGRRGRRERWFDPKNKTTWVSIEGRIGVATKNWRYAIRNAGE